MYHANWGIYDVPHTVASSYTVGGLYGGVAYLGNTRFGYFAESSELEVVFLQQISNNPKLGVAEAVSKSIFNAKSDRRKHVRHTHNLIGDPEFEIWKCSPSNLDVNVSWDASDIFVGGSNAVGTSVVVNNGEGNVRLKKVLIADRYPSLISNGGKMEAVGIFKTGYLPIVKLDCYNDELKDCDRRFVVRNAQIGCPEASSVVIGQNADIDVRAVDSIAVGSGVSIQSDGNLSLRCDKQVTLEGAEVASGGSLTVQGEEVTLSGGFSIKAGATLSITTN